MKQQLISTCDGSYATSTNAQLGSLISMAPEPTINKIKAKIETVILTVVDLEHFVSDLRRERKRFGGTFVNAHVTKMIFTAFLQAVCTKTSQF